MVAIIVSVALETFAATSMVIFAVDMYLSRRGKKISLLYLIMILVIAISIATLYTSGFMPPLPEGSY